PEIVCRLTRYPLDTGLPWVSEFRLGGNRNSDVSKLFRIVILDSKTSHHRHIVLMHRQVDGGTGIDVEFHVLRSGCNVCGTLHGLILTPNTSNILIYCIYSSSQRALVPCYELTSWIADSGAKAVKPKTNV